MALSRRLLSSMGIEDEKIDQIIEAHRETVDGLKDERDEYKEKAEKLDSVQKELDDLKAQGEKDPYKVKYEAAKEELENFKKDVEAQNAKAVKEKVFKQLLKDCNVSDKRIDSIIKVSGDIIDKLDLDKDGKFKDENAKNEVTKNIQSEWADFISTTEVKGAQTATPPAGGKSEDTREHRAAKIAAEYHQRLYGGTTQNTNANANNQTNKS